MSYDDPLLRALGAAQREEERAAEADPVPAVDAATTERLTRAALGARGVAEGTTSVVIPLRKPRGVGVIVALAAAFALAAGVALYVRTASDGAIPTYALSVSGDDQEHRGDDAGPKLARARFGHGARVRIDLRPAQPTSSHPDATAFLVRGGEARPANATVQRAESGAIRLEGTRESMFGDATGAWDLVVFIGAASELPRDVAAARVAVGSARVQQLVAPIELP